MPDRNDGYRTSESESSLSILALSTSIFLSALVLGGVHLYKKTPEQPRFF